MSKTPLCITYRNCCERKPNLNGCILGEGNYSIVSKIQCDTDINLKDKCNLAAKKNLKISPTQTIEDVQEEIEMLKVLKNQSPYIINLYHTENVSNTEVNLYLQLINGYDLNDYYNLRFTRKLNLKTFISGLVNGLNIIHNHNILHCDIKRENIVINTNVEPYPIPVYVDFGKSIKLNRFDKYGKRKGGTREYYLPGEEERCSKLSDIYALALMLIEVLFKTNIFEEIEIVISNKDPNKDHLSDIVEYLIKISERNQIEKNFEAICSLFTPDSNVIIYKESELDNNIPRYYFKDMIYSVLANIQRQIYSASKIPAKLASSVVSRTKKLAARRNNGMPITSVQKEEEKVAQYLGGKKKTYKRRRTIIRPTKRRIPTKRRKPIKRRIHTKRRR